MLFQHLADNINAIWYKIIIGREGVGADTLPASSFFGRGNSRPPPPFRLSTALSGMI